MAILLSKLVTLEADRRSPNDVRFRKARSILSISNDEGLSSLFALLLVLADIDGESYKVCCGCIGVLLEAIITADLLLLRCFVGLVIVMNGKRLDEQHGSKCCWVFCGVRRADEIFNRQVDRKTRRILSVGRARRNSEYVVLK
jgi:hypothetical protein